MNKEQQEIKDILDHASRVNDNMPKWMGGSGKLEERLKLLRKLEKDNQLMKETLEEIAKAPYPDSCLISLYKWCRARAKKVLEEIN